MRRDLVVHVCAVILALAAPVLLGPGRAQAQTGGLRVTIARPGEGETIYASPHGPLSRLSVTGQVFADNVAVTRLQVRLELIQGTRSLAALTTVPEADGGYDLVLVINQDVPMVHVECAETGCHNTAPGSLPAGRVLVRVTVSDPQGRQAAAQHSITVDHSGYAQVPVQVAVSGATNGELAGIKVKAETRLYEWRAREFYAQTDENGRAVLHVEALGQAPTRYIVQIEPTVLDGVLYRSLQPAELVLPPSAQTAPPVTLIAGSQRGQITGTVDSDSSLTIRAIQLPGGAGFVTRSTQSQFAFANLPIARYLIGVDDARAVLQTIDLTASPITNTKLALMNPSARSVRGIVRDDRGNLLPLAWVTTGDPTQTVPVSPASGAFALYGLAALTRSLTVTAPGYWSRPVALGADTLDIRLDPQPETRVVPWGTGTVTLPVQSVAHLAENRLTVQRGWVWGSGSGPLAISTRDLDITLSGGSFALSYLPGETNWLYVLQGQATAGKATVDAGHMLAFGKDVSEPAPVPLEDATVWALHRGEAVPVYVASDAASASRLRDAIERLGVPITWALFATGLAFAVIILRVRRRGMGQT